MIKIKLKDEELSVREGTRIIDLIPTENKRDYSVCKVGSQIKELRYKLTDKNDGKEIQLLGLENSEAGKTYEATLRYVVAMAFYNLYPKVQIRFSYNVSRAIFCQVLTKNFNICKETDAIKNEVKRIIAQDLPIERLTVTIDEAKELYQKYNFGDKAEILKYRPENTVHIYKCGDYQNYVHSYMLPSTGCLKNYAIKPYSPGLIIQYPRYELGAKIPSFIEEPTYGKSLQETYKWSKKAKLQTIAEINKKVETSPLEFVQMCEARQNAMMSALGKEIESNIADIRLIAIAGPSSSGKTTFCNKLKIELMCRGIQPVTISMDDYYLEKHKICEIQGKPLGELDLEHINCLDVERFNRDLFDLINGEEVTLPHFNFQTGKTEEGKTIKVEHNSPIIIEGIHALNDKLTASIPKHQKYKIYIAPQLQTNIDNHSPLNITDLRLIRRIVRDMQFRNCPAETTIDMWASVRSGEFKWIYPNQEGADFVFNSSLAYELCVLGTRALPALRKIGADEPQYLVANRLIKYLKYFKPIEDESIIPCNSLIREFIGGSCFKV